MELEKEKLQNECHPLLRKTLELPPKGASSIVLLRHSIRYQIPKGEFGNEIPLTSEGIQLAQELGSWIPKNIGTIFSSRVDRCIQTAENIIKGAKINKKIYPENLLGTPGPFIIDAELVGKLFLELGNIELFQRLFSGEVLAGTQSIQKGVSQLFDHFEQNLKSRYCNYYITHDNIILGVVNYLLGKKGFITNDWPWILEGAVFWKEQEQWFLGWRGKIHSFEL
jgi:broad specificity phosphatase PhoE